MRINATLYSPDTIEISEDGKSVVIKSSDEIGGPKTQDGNYIDFIIRPILPKGGKDWFTFSIDVLYRHHLVAWLPIKVPAVK